MLSVVVSEKTTLRQAGGFQVWMGDSLTGGFKQTLLSVVVSEETTLRQAGRIEVWLGTPSTGSAPDFEETAQSEGVGNQFGRRVSSNLETDEIS